MTFTARRRAFNILAALCLAAGLTSTPEAGAFLAVGVYFALTAVEITILESKQ